MAEITREEVIRFYCAGEKNFSRLDFSGLDLNGIDWSHATLIDCN